MAFATVGGFLRKVAGTGQGLGAVVVTTDSTDPLLVDSREAVITDREVNGVGDGAGDVVTYTATYANGSTLDWTDTYNSDGSLHSHVHA